MRVTTIEALSVQLKHKDEAIELISNKLDQLENSTLSKKNNSFQENRKPNSDELRTLEHKIDSINKELNDKNQVINFYARLLANLKNKLIEKSWYFIASAIKSPHLKCPGSSPSDDRQQLAYSYLPRARRSHGTLFASHVGNLGYRAS